MKDYRDRIRNLISRLYEPADLNNFDVRMTTPGIYGNLCTVIPANAFDEFDVVEVLEELGFEPQYEKKREITENDKGEKAVREYDDLAYFWYMKKKE